MKNLSPDQLDPLVQLPGKVIRIGIVTIYGKRFFDFIEGLFHFCYRNQELFLKIIRFGQTLISYSNVRNYRFSEGIRAIYWDNSLCCVGDWVAFLSALTPLESKIPEWLSYGVMPIAGFSDQGTKQNPIKNGFFRRKNQVEALVKQVMEAFDGILTSVSYRRGELIHASNATCNSLFIVKSGILRSYYFKDGKDITAHFAMR
nr:hypothetical protein [Cyclobacterium salsum]